DNTLPLIGVTVAINTLAVIVSLTLKNIQVNRFKVLVLSIMGFNMICIGAVVIDNFDVTIFVKNIANTVLNYSVLMYGFTMPLVMLFYNELWKKELKRIVKKICFGRENTHQAVNTKSTFGKDMIVNTAESSQRYFEMLQKEWYS
ncbi:hypothetical protein TELCIR_11588, partial [Teladorsagia circumcincta]